MRLISHRGNIDKKDPDAENSLSYIQAANDEGFDVEADFWLIDGKWWLGHDGPRYAIDIDWIINNKKYLWCHAKNINALYGLIGSGLEVFYHQTDDVTLTAHNYLWTYPGKRPLTHISIAVMPENTDWTMSELSKCAGICSDFIVKYKVDE